MTTNPQRTMLGITMAIASGALMAGSVYQWELPWLALVAWVPAILAQHVVLPQRVSYLGPALAWFGYLALAVVPALAPDLGALIWLLPFGIALISALLERKTVLEQVAIGYRYFWWSSAAAFTAVEFGRTFIPAQGTWSLVGYGLVPDSGWRFMASLVGLLGLCFAVWACNFAIGHVLLVWLGRARREGFAYRGALAVILGVTVISLLPTPTTASGPVQTLRVAAIQVGVDPDLEPALRGLGAEAWSENWLAVGMDETRRAAGAGARLVVWPEGFLRLDPRQTPQLRAGLEALVRETNVALVVGYVVAEPEGRRNEAVLISPDGQWHVTTKDHPVPWAESGTAQGDTFAIAEVDGVRVGVMICYDADFTDTMRERAGAGADLVVAPAHDWQAIAAPRLRHVQLRAAENRVPVVMADWSVGSAAVSSDGVVLGGAPLNELASTQVVVDVPVGEGDAPYTTTGDLAGWAAVALLPLGPLLTSRAGRSAGNRKAA